MSWFFLGSQSFTCKILGIEQKLKWLIEVDVGEWFQSSIKWANKLHHPSHDDYTMQTNCSGNLLHQLCRLDNFICNLITLIQPPHKYCTINAHICNGVITFICHMKRLIDSLLFSKETKSLLKVLMIREFGTCYCPSMISKASQSKESQQHKQGIGNVITGVQCHSPSSCVLSSICWTFSHSLFQNMANNKT